MATPYSDVFEKFSYLMRDNSHLPFTDTEIEEIFTMYLSFGCFYFTECEQDLTDRDDETLTFNIDLTENEQWIVAHGMVICWIKPLLNYNENMVITIGDRDYSPSSSGNLISKLSAMLEASESELEGYIISYSFDMNDLDELGN